MYKKDPAASLIAVLAATSGQIMEMLLGVTRFKTPNLVWAVVASFLPMISKGTVQEARFQCRAI